MLESLYYTSVLFKITFLLYIVSLLAYLTGLVGKRKIFGAIPYIMFALALFFGKYFTKEPVLKKIMGKSIPLTDIGWEILNRRWMFFFFGLALLNEFVWRTQTEEFWVNFKVWGMLPITIVFTGFQVPLINKHKIDAQ